MVDRRTDAQSLDAMAGRTSAQRGLLKHPVRRAIVEEVNDAPGLNITQLSDRVDVYRNTVAYHLDVFEEHDLVSTFTTSNGRLVFLSHQEHLAEDPRTRILFTRPTAREIALLLVQHPGEETRSITDTLDRSRSAVLRHLRDLRAFDLVERVPDGAGFAYHPTPRLIGWARALNTT